jgi:2-keto-4-pentenoate hydratase/2-oxohepta-3-ene-1,7-dioic acid hydratase in catechol pathway
MRQIAFSSAPISRNISPPDAFGVTLPSRGGMAPPAWLIGCPDADKRAHCGRTKRGNAMKLVTFVKAGEERLGLLAGETVIDPLAASGNPAVFGSVLAFIKSGTVGISAAKAMLANLPKQATMGLKDVKLAAPIRPATILCSGSNYRDHNAEKANTPISGKEPEFFVKTADCVVGPEEPIAFDERFSKKIDCETELAIVIGKPGRFIETSRALDHVFGYTIVNDVTARDRQVRRTPEGMTWYELGSGKAFDSGAPLGPCIVTADDIADPQNLKVTSRINGELRQSSNTSNMIWTCAELIHFFSRNFTLKPGMVIITGTPAGTAWSADKELGGKGVTQPGLVPATRYCLPGDIVECEVEKIGTLRNPIAQAGAAASSIAAE